MFWMRAALVSSGIAICTSASPAQTVWYVDDDAEAGGDGSSWQNPLQSLQAALALALPGHEIRVAEGIYTPSDTDATVSFVLRSGVAIFGGFPGLESTRGGRDPELYPTILSGDIGRDDTTNPLNFNSSNSGHVVVASGVDDTAVLDGFTIEHGAYGPSGTPAGDELMFGSGLYAVDGSPTINGCVFDSNYAAFASGGGMYLWDSSPSITNCEFRNNYVHLGNGGGVFMGGTSAPTIEDCTFYNNTCVFSTPDASGGGLYHYSSVPLTVTRCRFDSNVVRPFYSVGDDTGYGGGISSFSGTISVFDSVFVNNRATIGGGMIAWAPATIVNCLFADNTAQAREGTFFELGGFGAGFSAYSFQPDEMLLLNCTFANNHGKEDSGVFGGWNATAVLRNCVLWGNTGWKPEIQGYWREQIGGNFDIAYCLIANIFGPPEVGEDPIDDPEDLLGVIDLDPIFLGATDFHLSPGSPAIDSGANGAWTPAFSHDLDMLPRFVDDPVVTDTGLGDAPIIDMGVYEVQATPAPCNAADMAIPFDLLDFSDVVAFLSAFGAMSPAADLAPPVGAFDFSDVVAFLGAFGAGCP